MADRTISELTQVSVSELNESDSFVLQHEGRANQLKWGDLSEGIRESIGVASLEEKLDNFAIGAVRYDGEQTALTSEEKKTARKNIGLGNVPEGFNPRDKADASALAQKADKVDVDLKANKADVEKKADKTDTVLETTLSRGRVPESEVGTGSLAFGTNVTASGNFTVAMGNNTQATANFAHAEGMDTKAQAANAFAEGFSTTAAGAQSHAEGYGTKAMSDNQHVEGQYNVQDEAGLYAHIVGNGASFANPSNAYTLDWHGNAQFAGDVIAKGCGGETPISLTTLAQTVAESEENVTKKVEEALEGISDTAVSYEPMEPALTEEQKAQARDNIGFDDAVAQVIDTLDIKASSDAVLYTPQILDDDKKIQARSNIGAAASAVVAEIQTAINSAVTDVTETTTGIRVTYKTGEPKDILINASGSGVSRISLDSETNELHIYVMDGEEEIEAQGSPIVLPQGGGGGETAGSATLLRSESQKDGNVIGLFGQPINIEFVLNGETASGEELSDCTGEWYDNGIRIARSTVHFGENTFDISPYITQAGIHKIQLRINDIDVGTDIPLSRKNNWTLRVVNLSIEWNYDDAQVNTGNVVDMFTPWGGIPKTIHTTVAGEYLPDIFTSNSGQEMSMTIPVHSHGAYGVRRWITATVDDIPVTIPPVYHEMVWVEAGRTLPIIAVSKEVSDINQYDTIQLPIFVYDPQNITTNVELLVDGEHFADWTNIDRTVHYWNWTAGESGDHVLSIRCGEASHGIARRDISIHVNPVQISASEVEGYSYKFKASEMPTNDAVRIWSSNGVTAEFSDDFDWINGGIQSDYDEKGRPQQLFRVKAGTTMTIKHKLFGEDPRSNGITFKIVFKVRNARDYDAQFMHCFADDVGIRMYAHNTIIKSAGTSINMLYGEDEYTELEFDVYPSNSQATYLMGWMDGVISTARVYKSESFVQSIENAENIIIGSEDCDVDIYMVKAYPFRVTRDGHIDNFIMDAPNATELAERYSRNNIIDSETGLISADMLYEQNPDCRIWLYDIPQMTNGKKDEVEGTFTQRWKSGSSYYDGMSGTGKMTVQGTSSLNYIRGAANTDFNFTSIQDGEGHDLIANGTQDKTKKYGNNYYVGSNGNVTVFDVEEGTKLDETCIVVERDENGNATKYIKALGYKINDGSTPITYTNTKVNFASCEQINNMGNAAWYQNFQPFQSRTKRDTMEFVMGVQFIKDSGTVSDEGHFVLFGDNAYHFYSIANMGTSKKNLHVFHDLSNELDCCVEVKDSATPLQRMISKDFSNEDFSGDHDFEFRYPSKPTDRMKTAFIDFVSWLADNNPNAATGLELSPAETYEPYTFRGHNMGGEEVLRGTTVSQYAGTYTHDTFERRMAKMLSECEDHMVMDSVVYHFLFQERHTLVDNVAKNNFWSSRDLVHWDLSKAYDMDTSDGNNNDGLMKFDYGLEMNDLYPDGSGQWVYNGHDSVWFQFVGNLFEACRTMFQNREVAKSNDGKYTGAWSAKAYHEFLLSEQRKIPERIWVECYWYDYLRTYENGINQGWIEFLDGGQKTHQRKHYETFEEAYDSSKYQGLAIKNNPVVFRAQTPSTYHGITPKNELTIKMYNKMYVQIQVGEHVFPSNGTIPAPVKADKGELVTIDFSSVGALNAAVIRLYTPQYIQEIDGIAQLYITQANIAPAVRLKKIQIGSAVLGYHNNSLTSIEFGANPNLEEVGVQNLKSTQAALDLSGCPNVKKVDARGSTFTAYQFADGGMLDEAYIEAPTALDMRNLKYLTDENLHIYDYSLIQSLRIEYCPNIDTLAMLTACTNSNLALRLLGIDWSMNRADTLNRAILLRGINEAGVVSTRPPAVLTGDCYVSSISDADLVGFNEAWAPGLEITYGTKIATFRVSFKNWDGSPVLDRRGNEYYQNIENMRLAYDPVEAGEIDPPTREPDEQYKYTYSGWDYDFNVPIISSRDIKPVYSTEDQYYTVNWYNDADLLKTKRYKYGSEAFYNDDDPYAIPVLNDMESYGYYKIFKGWDNSTGFIRGNLDVKVKYDGSYTPPAGKQLNDMTFAEIKAASKMDIADNYFKDKDSFRFRLGNDYNFDNVTSFTPSYSSMWIDSSRVQNYDGRDSVHELVSLFDEFAGDFTLQIDFEFFSENEGATLVSCYETEGAEGFRLYMHSGNPTIQWGDKTCTCGYKTTRGVVVLRHPKGSNDLIVYWMDVTKLAGDGFPLLTDDAVSVKLTRTASTTTNAHLMFGGHGTRDEEGNYSDQCEGWVHFCKVWYDDLGDGIAKQMALLPRIELRMEYYGKNRYNYLGTTTKCGTSFYCTTMLPYHYTRGIIQEEGFNEYSGYEGYTLRNFYNGRIFHSLPYELQSSIADVSVPSNGGYNRQNVRITAEKLFPLAYIEIYPGASGRTLYASEGEPISWMTSYLYRARQVFEIPDDATVYTSDIDPTYNTTCKTGDVWKLSSYLGMYLDEEYVSRHKFAGRELSHSTNQYSATGGGVWVRYTNTYTRTKYYSAGWANEFFYQGYNTSPDSNNSSYFSLNFAFSM